MTAAAQVHWVVCDDYAAGPYTPGHARRLLDSITAGRDLPSGCCTLEHRVTVSGVQPTTGSELARLRREHQAAALASDPFAGPTPSWPPSWPSVSPRSWPPTWVPATGS